MSRVSMFAVVSCLLVLMLAGPVFAIELVTNGGFELNGGAGTSIFTGWTAVSQQYSNGAWLVGSGTTAPFSGAPTPGPAGGTYYAIGDDTNASACVLYQTVTIPTWGVGTLSYDLFVNNYDGSYIDLSGLDYTSGGSEAANQYCTVDLLADGSDVFSASSLSNFYLGDDGSNPPYPWTHYSFTGPVPAGIYILRFGFVNNRADLNMGVDNVSIDFTPEAQLPEPSSLLLLLTALPFGIILKRRGKAA